VKRGPNRRSPDQIKKEEEKIGSLAASDTSAASAIVGFEMGASFVSIETCHLGLLLVFASAIQLAFKSELLFWGTFAVLFCACIYLRVIILRKILLS